MPTKEMERKSPLTGKELELDKRDAEIVAYCLLECCRDRGR